MAPDDNQANLEAEGAAAAAALERNARLEAYIADGRAKMQAALQAQPFRGAPSYADLLVMGEAMLRHLFSATPGDDAYAPPAPAPAAPQPPDPSAPEGAAGAAP